MGGVVSGRHGTGYVLDLGSLSSQRFESVQKMSQTPGKAGKDTAKRIANEQDLHQGTLPSAEAAREILCSSAGEFGPGEALAPCIRAISA